MRFEPASTIIEKCGGVAEMARLSGVSHASVSRWQAPKTVGGTGGIIPQKNIPNIITNAKCDRDVVLDWSDFAPPSIAAAE